MEKKSNFLSCENLDRVANWVGFNMASAFFASLERCSCINFNTTDLDESDDPDESKDKSLLVSGPTSHRADSVQLQAPTSCKSDELTNVPPV